MNTLLNKLRSIFLSPNSDFELSLRTLYHKVAATRLFFLFQNFLAKRSFRKFRILQQQKSPPEPDRLAHKPTVTFLLSCFEASPSAVHVTLQSIQSLQDDNWEVILVSPEGDSDDIITEINEPRVKQARPDQPNPLRRINGEYVVFCEAGDKFFDTLLHQFYATLTGNPPADLTYYDCEYFHEQSGEIKPFFKPSALSPALLLSANYLSRGFIRRETLQAIWPETTPSPDLLCQAYEIVLRLCEGGKTFQHIPALLIHQKRLEKPDDPKKIKIIEAHLDRQGLTAVSTSREANGVRFSWAAGNPSLAIIIPSKNNRSLLEPLVRSLLNQPYQGELSIHIVDNNSKEPDTIAYYDTIQQSEPRVAIIPYQKPFNYSEAINLGVATSESDLVLLLNDDMAHLNQDAIPELAQWAIRNDVGVVGAKLLRKNRTIQHAGIILGLTGFTGHVNLNAPENYHGLFGSVNWYRNYLALTGACQMVRRDVFKEVGGYDQGYQLAFGDIDFCLKVHKKGYQNVYTPFAQFYHYEGSSRGYQTPPEDVLKGYAQMETYLVAEDPFFSPNLTYTRIPKCVLKKRSHDARQKQIEVRKGFYLKKR